MTTPEQITALGVYAAINAIQADLATTGITKNHKNTQQGYRFRGIDDVYNAVSHLLARHRLCILPRVLTRSVTEKQTKNGGTMFYSVLEVEFDLVCSTDGSKHTIRTIGEAMDSADKSSNKAMSAAYKYAVMQTFAIPTEGDNDADVSTPEVGPSQTLLAMREAAMQGSEALKQVFADLKAAPDLPAVWKANSAALKAAAQAVDNE